MLQLFLHQETHGRFRDEFCDAGCRCMRAMRRAKCVIHIKIAQFGQRFREFRIVRLLLRLEADVLEQGDIAILHVANDFFWHVPNRVVTENDGLVDQRVQIIADRTK